MTSDPTDAVTTADAPGADAWQPTPRWRRATRRMSRPSLLTRYGITSLVLFIALGSLLGHLLQRSVEQRVLDSAVREAQVVARIGVQESIVPEEITSGLSDDRVRALERAFTVNLSPLDIVEVGIFDLDGRVVFATDTTEIGEPAEPSTHLSRALQGQAVAAISDMSEADDPILRRHGEVLVAYLPLQFGHGPAVPQDGVISTTLPYAPIRATIEADTRRLYAVLAGALAVLWVVLFRLVAGASRALRHQSAENERQALHDRLTGLPNRSLFQDRLEHTVTAAQRSDERVGVVIMDLDRFKEVNDTLGHHHGDVLLTQVAHRLRDTLRSGDTVARLGGDEFAFLLPAIGSDADAVAVAEKVRAALERPFDILGLSLEVGASLGIAMYPDHATTPDALLQKADVAMYAAKRDQRGQTLYDPSDDGHSTDRLVLAGELRRAIDQGELVLHYQPKVHVASGVVTDAEALVRWDHPERGRLSPDQFVPIAERSDLIQPFTEAVLDMALRDCRAWNDRGHTVGVAVNLSVRNLHGGDLVNVVARLLDHHGVPAGMLTLEITETMIAADPGRARAVVVGLRGLGVRMSIDDFGTGYSSLAVLRTMPVNELKIDRSFVNDVLSSPDAAAIVEFSRELGHQLGLAVVAEGVEDARTASILARIGCDLAQGYWYARPLAFQALLLHLADNDSTHLGDGGPDRSVTGPSAMIHG